MSVKYILSAIALAALVSPTAASAQFFFQSPALADEPVTGEEVGIGLPGATRAENDAALIWNLRAALNVAALQCDFAPALLTTWNYNGMLKDHSAELKTSFDTLGKYFVRMKKTKVAGQNAFDQYGTRVYSGYSTVGGQLTFCQTAHSIGRDAIFTDRGKLLDVSKSRLRELRKSLLTAGDQRFPGYAPRPIRLGWLPNTDKRCWKGSDWNESKCGAPYPVMTAIAAR